MTRMADAEKMTGATKWTVYGPRGIWHAKRDASSGIWHAHGRDCGGYASGRTLRECRIKIAMGA